MKRPDEIVLGDIWQAIYKQETIRSIDIHDISINVEDGQVCLSGHISKDNNDQRIEAIAYTVSGVTAVHNHLVTDHDLSIQVAQALGENEQTRPLVLPVASNHGWIQLGGMVPNRELQRVAEKVAARVPTVRGIIMLPRIEGEDDKTHTRFVQPRIGVRVYGENGIEGIVVQVVIQPNNRLVSHAIVRVNQTIDGRHKSCDYMVPVQSMRIVDLGGIFLNRNSPAINAFPAYNPKEYPFAPLTWQPPYPYTVGNVRWPCQANMEFENQADLKTMPRAAEKKASILEPVSIQ